jgi:hypothetical protein
MLYRDSDDRAKSMRNSKKSWKNNFVVGTGIKLQILLSF